MYEYRLIGADEVAKRLGVSKGTAYRIIRDLNADMKAEGKKTISGKVDEGKFMSPILPMLQEGARTMSVRREENDTWTAQVWYRDARGHRRQTIKRGFETEDEASGGRGSSATSRCLALRRSFSHHEKTQ